MFQFEVPLLKKKYARVAVTDYPDQEAYASLPQQLEGKEQPVIIGHHTFSGATDFETFAKAIPTDLVNGGTEINPATRANQTGTGVWKTRQFKICATVKNPKTGITHGINAPDVFKFSDGIVTPLAVTTNYTLSQNNTLITMVNSANGDLKTADEIRVANVAYLDDASGTFTGTASATIRFIYDVVDFLAHAFTDVPSTRLSKSSFTFLGSSKPGVTSGTFDRPEWMFPLSAVLKEDLLAWGYFDGPIDVIEVIDILAFSVDCSFQPTGAGVYTLLPFRHLTDLTTPSLINSDLADYTEGFTLDSIINRIAVMWNQTPGGSQKLTGALPPIGTKKQQKRKKYKPGPTSFTMEVKEYDIERNDLTKTRGGDSYRDDFGEIMGVENNFEVLTFWGSQAAAGGTTTAKKFANELYRRWGRGLHYLKFTDVSGALINIPATEQFYVHRTKSGIPGLIESGVPFRLLDAVPNIRNQQIRVLNAERVSILQKLNG